MGNPQRLAHDVDAAQQIAALLAENRDLRAQLAELDLQVTEVQSAVRAVTASRAFRLVSPQRRAAKELRMLRQNRRRAAQLVQWPPAGAPPAGGADLSPTGAGDPGLLAGTPARLGQPDPGAARVLVIAHVFYPKLWRELAARIELIPESVDLVVSLVRGSSDHLQAEVVSQFPNSRVGVVENRGRDMLPLLQVLDLGLVGDYDAVLKIHTKSSGHRRDGGRWRDELLDSLCPSPEGIALILQLLRKDPRVGMISPDRNILGAEFWGANTPLVEAIAARVPIDFDPDRVWFAAGSMFWTRPRVLNRLREPGLTTADFEPECGALDATLAHALERYIGVVVAAEGQAVLQAGEACRAAALLAAIQ